MVKIVEKSRGLRFKKEPVAAEKRPAICLAFVGILFIMAGAMIIGVSVNGQNDVGLKVGGSLCIIGGVGLLIGGFTYKYVVHHRMKAKREIYAVPAEDPDIEDFRASTPIEPIDIPLDRRRSTIVNGVIIRVPNNRLRKLGILGPQLTEDPDGDLDTESIRTNPTPMPSPKPSPRSKSTSTKSKISDDSGVDSPTPEAQVRDLKNSKELTENRKTARGLGDREGSSELENTDDSNSTKPADKAQKKANNISGETTPRSKARKPESTEEFDSNDAVQEKPRKHRKKKKQKPDNLQSGNLEDMVTEDMEYTSEV